ncbi:MAG: TIGR01906 family membrane protein [Erysipelotrichaceae bacterium]|nr:TIGR01906 family membrane protein [Erysipelotrichaceae bacterium]MDP3304477.1 TIGR01906 family membrane protein [Erysipelotrichaceae bacterium]
MFKLLRTLAYIAIFVATIITAVDVMSFDVNFFKDFYSKNDSATEIGVSFSDLMLSTEVLLDYTQGKYDSLDVTVTVDGRREMMFNKREVDHMVDVKNLYLGAILIRNLAAVFFVSVILFDVLRKRFSFEQHWHAVKNAGVIMFALIAFIVMAAVIDFNTFWTNFHLIFFRNDLWLLNPNTDRLINMVPLNFFISLVTRIIIASVTGLSVIIGCVYIFVRKERNA